MKMPVRIAFYIVVCGLTAALFFQTWKALAVLIPIFVIRGIRERKEWQQHRRKVLEEQFRDSLQCLLGALEAGYSVENSVARAESDLRLMFGDKAPIVQEFEKMRRKLDIGSNVEDVMEEFGERSGVEDIQNFASIFSIAKRTGGDVINVIRSATEMLYQKQEVRREIQTVLLAKQLEVGIMKGMPYVMLAYFLLFSPEFLNPLYQGMTGHFLMLLLYLLYRVCCLFAEKIARIDV